MRHFWISLLITTFLVSCRKDDFFSARLISTKYEILSFPKVYTRQGEITDKAVIASYISGWGSNYFVFTADTVINEPADELLFKTKDTLIFPHLQRDWGKRVVKQNGAYLFFYLPDTLLGNKRMDNVLNSIVDKIGIVKPFYMDACPWYGGSNGASCQTQWVYDAFLATGSTNRLEFPLLTYKITRRQNGFSAGMATQNYNNVFDPAVLHLLQDGDTLAIQTAKRVYSRRY